MSAIELGWMTPLLTGRMPCRTSTQQGVGIVEWGAPELLTRAQDYVQLAGRRSSFSALRRCRCSACVQPAPTGAACSAGDVWRRDSAVSHQSEERFGSNITTKFGA